ncbi:glycosyltransferase family 15 protein [Plicaturopsis crispa FD-325 SS-3]|uniref:Glycosyltransferase family 15 protein n=1 Tax=Plicaturopsis crispa FD-325 SS-3 TaxID=944288 RepID=A0A0C9T6E6_PLICR|nr:glycosyltransferase family 15 protein [Plicaturopsis crispa FD-325 SS-3]
MNTPARYLLLVLGIVVSLHYLLSFTHEEYGRATSFSNIASQFRGQGHASIPEDYYSAAPTSNATNTERANATFVFLARNSDLSGVIQSMRDAEDRFNHKHNYPWVFLNEEPFTDEFKKRVSVLTKAPIEFGLIPKEHWEQPSFIDVDRATESRKKMEQDNIIYGGSLSYRNMCRFNSGFFYRHELLQKYRYYWRVEPDVHFHCDIDFDPFLFMQREKKVYGFTIAIYEFEKTIPTLWNAVKEFAKAHPQYIANDNAMDFVSDTAGETYNLCHFWSNFEIADLDFWRGDAYSAFFDFLDQKGGFHYERWGDAPVHSIAAALFLPRQDIHFFNEIGYEHNPYTHCPSTAGDDKWTKGRCACDPNRSFDYDGYSCMRQWDRVNAA